MNRRLFVTLLLITLLAALLSGCAAQTDQKAASPPPEKWIRYNHGPEPDTIDPTLNVTIDGGTVILAVFEGLTKIDKYNNPSPGIAKNWTISPDKTKYTFHLREDAKWSDGKTVTAGDFYYSWKRALNPQTAAEYSYMLFYIKNAEKYYSDSTGKVNFEDVGIKVINDATLEVTLESPTPYFLKITAFPTLLPLREDIISKYGDKWTRSPESYIGNGPFKLAEWKSRDSLKLIKNDKYYASNNIKLNGVYMTFISEESTMLSAFEAGELDVIDSVPLDEIARLKKESKEFYAIPQLGTYYYSINVKKAPLKDSRVRKALALAVDREDLVNKVVKSGVPATAFTPPGVPDAEPGRDFRATGGDFFPAKAQIPEAQKLLAEAGYPGGKGFPSVTLVYNTSEKHKKIAEAVQEMWKQNLGINVKLQNQEWNVYMESVLKGQFQMARTLWVADYNDAMSFIEPFTTNNGNNLPQWSNKNYDNLIAKARTTDSERERIDLLHQAEKLFMDDAILLPLFHDTENCMIKTYVKDLYKSPLGFTFFDGADIIK